jgi:hypothetical protein
LRQPGCFERQLSKARIESIILDGLKKHPGSMLSEFVKNAEWGVSLRTISQMNST